MIELTDDLNTVQSIYPGLTFEIRLDRRMMELVLIVSFEGKRIKRLMKIANAIGPSFYNELVAMAEEI